MTKIGYYAHAHGSGHCRYADHINRLAQGSIPVFTSRPYPFVHAKHIIWLESDVMSDAEAAEYALPPPPRYLHYAPVGFRPIQRRSLKMMTAIRDFGIDLMIVDVSVEIAALLRSSSVPYVYRRMPGDRSDLPHQEAFRGAAGVIAYYPEMMEAADTPDWLRAKTTYLGFKPQPSADEGELYSIRAWWNIPEGQPIISVVTGFGGAGEVDRVLPQIRKAYPEHFILGLGHFAESSHAFLNKNAGILPDISSYLQQSDVIVGACGSNLATEALASGTPFVPIACARPHQEQTTLADSLCREGLCTSVADFLVGVPPVTIPKNRLTAVMDNQYARYFGQILAADDWRSALKLPTLECLFATTS